MGVLGYEMWVGGCIADPISHITHIMYLLDLLIADNKNNDH